MDLDYLFGADHYRDYPAGCWRHELFDSVCHSLTTTATGGYSTKQNSIAAFNSPYIEYIITLFMFLAGINFTLLYLLFLKGNFKRLFQNTELHWYLGTVGFYPFHYRHSYFHQSVRY